MMSKKLLAFLMIIIIVSVPLGGCIDKKEEPKEVPKEVTKENITVKVGYLPSMCQAIYVLKEYKTLERELGVDAVEYKRYESGPLITQAFAQGDADIGFMGIPPVMIGIDKGVPIKVIASTHSEGSSLIAKSKRYKNLTQLGSIQAVLKQFDGKSIGAPGKGSIQDVILRTELKKAGVNATVKNIPVASTLPALLNEGQIEAYVVWPPFEMEGVLKGYGDVVIPSDKLWPYNPCCALVVTEKFEKEHPDTVQKLVELHNYASLFIMAHPEELADAANAELGIDNETALASIEFSPKYCALPDERYINSTMDFVNALKDLGYTTNNLTREQIFDLKYIQKAHPGPYDEPGTVKDDPAIDKIIKG
ncbi:MAG: ABC transporter substrate-binding protein [Candidatus Methanoperedens sp.]|nr:ABC transporter substrate-binding protein [Candidatus Methanoperedens sp.]